MSVKTFALTHYNIKSILLITDVYIALDKKRLQHDLPLKKSTKKFFLPHIELEDSISLQRKLVLEVIFPHSFQLSVNPYRLY